MGIAELVGQPEAEIDELTQTNGSIRIINLMQSLGGFTVLTWSATFLYAICERAWRE